MLTKNLNAILLVLILTLILISIYIIKLDVGTKKVEQTATVKETEYQKTLYLGITKYDTLNPIKTKSMDVFYLNKLMYKPILDIDKNFNVAAGIASECSKISDTKYILVVNNDLSWSDGEKIVADDIIYTINMIKQYGGIYYKNVENILSVNKINETTIEIDLKEKQSKFEYMLTIPIIKQNEYDLEAPTTSGMYKIKEVNENNIILEKSGDDGFSKILINVYETPSKLYSAINKNEIDLLITKNIQYFDYIGAIGNSVTKVNGMENTYIKINVEDNILKNKEIRQALKYGINKMDLNYKLFNNEMIVINTFFEDELKIEYTDLDIDKAIRLIKNKKIHLDLLVDNERNMNIAKEIKIQLKNIGIDVDIKQVYNIEENIKNKQYQIAIITKQEDITRNLSLFFEEDLEEINKTIKEVENIENSNIYREKIKEILEKNNTEIYLITLFKNPIYIVHNNTIQGDFSGNWYHLFYNINDWYKIEKK